MDNKKITDPSGNDRLEDLLVTPNAGKEIREDAHAVFAHDMPNISDMELEKILQESFDNEWNEDPITDNAEADAADASADGAAEYTDLGFDDYVDGTVPRKVRPKRKKGYGLFGLPHLASTAIWLLIALAIGISLGRLVWVCATDLLAFGRPDHTVSITITESDTLDTVTSKLHNAGLIKYPELFKMYCDLAKVEEKGKISVGTFELNTLYDYHALVAGMSATSSYRETTEIMIPEGYTCAQIFALLEEKGVCSVSALEEYASTSEFADYWFLEGVERGNKYCLEGYLFPDTYEFYTNDTPRRVFIKFLNRFDDQFDEEMRSMFEDLNAGLSEKNKVTFHELVIIASMIEKESAHSGESMDISSVIYNRLASSAYPYLNIDATVVYALNGKTPLEPGDTDIDHPYNTYKYKGLPPGPISNPGLLSLKAALMPSDTKYYFYALDTSSGTREHRFFKTYEEHLNFINGR